VYSLLLEQRNIIHHTSLHCNFVTNCRYPPFYSLRSTQLRPFVESCIFVHDRRVGGVAKSNHAIEWLHHIGQGEATYFIRDFLWKVARSRLRSHNKATPANMTKKLATGYFQKLAFSFSNTSIKDGLYYYNSSSQIERITKIQVKLGNNLLNNIAHESNIELDWKVINKYPFVRRIIFISNNLM